MSKLEELLKEQQRLADEIKRETELQTQRAAAEQELKLIEAREASAKEEMEKATAEKEKIQQAIASGNFAGLSILAVPRQVEDNIFVIPTTNIDVDEISAAIEKQTEVGEEDPFILPGLDIDEISPAVEEPTEVAVVPASAKVTERLKSNKSWIAKGAVAIAIVAALALGIFGFKKVKGLVNELRTAIAANTGALGNNTDATIDNTGATTGNTDAVNENTDATRDNTDALRDNTGATRDNTDAVRNNTDATNRNTGAVGRNISGQTGEGLTGPGGVIPGQPVVQNPTTPWPQTPIKPPNPPTPPGGGTVLDPRDDMSNPATVHVGDNEAFINTNTNESHVGSNGWGHGGIDGTFSAGENPNNLIINHPDGSSTIIFDSPAASNNPVAYYDSVQGSGMDHSLLQSVINEELGNSR